MTTREASKVLGGTWTELNAFLIECESEGDVQKLLEMEKRGLARKAWLTRLHSRYNRLRRTRERQEWLTP